MVVQRGSPNAVRPDRFRPGPGLLELRQVSRLTA